MKQRRRTSESAERDAAVISQLSEERGVLRDILYSMNTGVVYIGADGCTQFINEAAIVMLRRPIEQCLGYDHWTLFHNPILGNAMDRAIFYGTAWREELTLDEQLIVDARILPIQSETSHSDSLMHEVVLLLSDISQWRRVERLRTEFIANVSHELKTPITSIYGFAETLLEDDLDNRTRRSFTTVIRDEAERMRTLVSDLLTLSRLEHDGITIPLQSVSLWRVVQQAVLRLQSLSNHKGIRMTVADNEALHVWANEAYLLQVMMNLLSNAIQYTPDGGEIRIVVDVLVDRVKVHVIDSGIGIDPIHHEHIFERFYRVDKDRSRTTGGTGLGLAIVKHMIQLHGGDLGVISQPGAGSDFWFTLRVCTI